MSILLLRNPWEDRESYLLLELISLVLKELIILVKTWVGFWILRNQFSLRNEKCSLEKNIYIYAIVRNTNISLIKKFNFWKLEICLRLCKNNNNNK